MGILIRLLIFMWGIVTKCHGYNYDDGHALLLLKQQLGAKEVLQSWHVPTNKTKLGNHKYFCTWDYVKCDKKGERVERLYLGGWRDEFGGAYLDGSPFRNLTSLRYLNLMRNNLKGNFPVDLPSSLRYLYLNGNELSGPLPPTSFENLYNLRHLVLSNNFFSGPIPEVVVTNYTQLRWLLLGQTNLSGNIPPTFHLPNLEVLSIWFTQRLSGPIPSSIANSSKLTTIELSMNALTGIIPSEFSKLQNLQILHLFWNELTGPVPSSIYTNCTQITDITLFNNSLSGEILPPNVGNLINLSILYLYGNKFNGSIPSSLSNCSQLQVLDLSSNFALSGELPKELGLLSNIVYFNLDETNITGTIPLSLGNCTSLENLQISNTKIHGTIPLELGFLINLNQLFFHSNSFSGPIPSSLFNNLTLLTNVTLNFNQFSGIIPPPLFSSSQDLVSVDLGSNNFVGEIPPLLNTKLSEIYMSNNDLSGQIPLSLANCTNITKIDLAGNKFEGKIPTFLFNDLPQLSYLDLSRNNFSGQFPPLINQKTPLFHLSLSSNMLSGIIHGSQIANLNSFLGLLDLSNNQFTGSIPREILKFSKLYSLNLSFNAFEGTIPMQIGKLSSLGYMDLQNNNLHGSLPVTLGNCKLLEILDLSNNQFSGTLMPSLLSSFGTKLNTLRLSQNNMSGPIPNETLLFATTIDLSYNAFSGPIPQSISQCLSLQSLTFSHNNISGTIPILLGENLKQLQYLDLSFNNLSGHIPENLAFIGAGLNLSHNALQGPIPEVYSNFSITTFMENMGLCGKPLPTLCPHQSHHHAKIFVFVLLGVICIFVLCGVMLCMLKKLGLLFSTSSSSSKNLGPISKLSFRVTEKELEHATNNFSDDNLLGSGGSSVVYKGVLSNGQVVAVKRFNIEDDPHKVEQIFKRECETLGSIKHRNLVPIISTCCNLDIKALVLEYMPHGSLEDILFNPKSPLYPQLSWEMLINIAIDVAKALVYLHHESHIKVIHCDLKPSNILLDENNVAHVADFGISRLLNNGNSSSFTRSYSNHFRGSIGYVAPECGQLAHHSSKGDVFSYGMVLLSMITRKQPTNDFFAENGINLVKWVSNKFPENFHDIVFNELHESIEANGFEGELISFIRLALLCTLDEPSKRPSSRQVLHMLTQIKSITDTTSTSSSKNVYQSSNSSF